MSRSITIHFPELSPLPRARYGILITATLAIVCSLGLALFNFQPARGLTPSLPGEQIWQDGVPSYLFGTNEVAWDPLALSNPAIMATVKAAGIPLIRVPLTASNAEARISLVQQSGAQCLGILSWHNPDDALKVAKMLGNRCLLYEFGNEPDPLSSYITTWNANITALRQANPNAKFIGPVLASPDANGIKTFLSAVKSNPPDIVSWHMYPCTNRTLQSCDSGNHINFSKHTQEIGAVIKNVLGHDLPQAITEYNYDWQDGKTPNHDATTMQTFMTQSLDDLIQASKYGLVMANEYQLGGRAGAGTLDMVNPSSGAPLAQFAVLSQYIAKYRANSTSQSTVTTTTDTGSPTLTSTVDTGGTTTATSTPDTGDTTATSTAVPASPTVISTVDTTTPTATVGTVNPTVTVSATVVVTKSNCADSSQKGASASDAPQAYTVTIGQRAFCCVLPAWMLSGANGQQGNMPVDVNQREIRCVLISSSGQQGSTTVTPTATSTTDGNSATPTPTSSSGKGKNKNKKYGTEDTPTPTPTPSQRPAIAPLPVPNVTPTATSSD